MKINKKWNKYELKRHKKEYMNKLKWNRNWKNIWNNYKKKSMKYKNLKKEIDIKERINKIKYIWIKNI